MSKGIAVHALVVIALIVMLLFFALIIFWKWIATQGIETSKAACTIKYQNCCLQLQEGNSCDWANTDPKDCERADVGISEPTKDQCKT
jgi:hypothetical protein